MRRGDGGVVLFALTIGAEIFAMAICWAEPDPPLSDINSLLQAVDEEVDLCEVFHTADALNGRKTQRK